MPDDEIGSRRRPRGSREAPPAFADDWPNVVASSVTAETSEVPARQRVARAMARAGLCSRREAETWVADGRVSVNGEVLTSPARDVGPDDHVEVDGQPLPAPEKTRLFLFHKPRGLVTSDYDPEGRETVSDHLRGNWPQGPRVVTVGRLDINTEGLLLLTNDGGLSRQLELPKTGWLRRYRVRAKGETDQGKLDALAGGIVLDEVEYAGIEATLDRVQGANCWLTMGLREGKNREIKRVLEHLGLEVNRLIRLSFGPFQLLDLPEGAVEEVRTRVLKDQLGATLAAEAGVDFGDAPAAPPVAPVPVATRRPATDGRGVKQKTERSRERSGPSSQSRSVSSRMGGEEPQRRRQAPVEATRDDRPQGRPRRHVSSLRNARQEDAASGPRKRIERSDTRDRNDRTVAVERKVSARSASRLSPSAEGKRARVARSGAQRDKTRNGPGDRRRTAAGGERAPVDTDGRRVRVRDRGERPLAGDRPRTPRREDAGGSSRNERTPQTRGENGSARTQRSGGPAQSARGASKGPAARARFAGGDRAGRSGGDKTGGGKPGKGRFGGGGGGRSPGGRPPRGGGAGGTSGRTKR